MSRLRRAFSSSVGTKLLIGLTGLALFAYLVLHLAGNALIFAGPEIFNEYSHTLISNPLIIPIEIGLLLIFLLHIYKTVTMWMNNSAARPVSYREKRYAGHTSRKSVASTTMIASGLVTLLFVLVHVKQFKYGAWYQTVSPDPVRDLYRTEIEVFRQPVWVAFYVICTLDRRASICGTASRVPFSRSDSITRCTRAVSRGWESQARPSSASAWH